MPAAVLPAPLNEAQLEILRLFAEGMTDDEVTALRQVLIDFKFNRVTALADSILDAKNISAKGLATQAQKIKRTTYRAKKAASKS